MFSFFCSCFAVLLLLLTCITTSEGNASGFFPPLNREVITMTGANATSQWRYCIAPNDQVDFSQIIWGIWNSYQPYPKLITVLARNEQVIPNRDLSTVAPSYSGRTYWNGNLNKSLIQFTLQNVSLSDQRTYGCFLVFGYLRPMIKSSLDLSVAEKAHKQGLIQQQHTITRALVDGYVNLSWSFLVPADLQNKLCRFTLALWDKRLQVFRNIVTRTKTGEIWSGALGASYKGRLWPVKWNRGSTTFLAKFRLLRLTQEDELRFFCIAHFDHPRRLFYASTRVVVEAAAVITNISKKVTVEEGKAFSLFCEADGKPAANVSWFVKGERLTRQRKRSTAERNATRDDEGWYWCEAVNDAGGQLRRARKSTFVEVKFEPFPPVITTIDPTPSSAKISWKSPDREKGRRILAFMIHLWTDQEGKRNGKVYSTEHSSYVSHGLRSNTNYNVRVYAKGSKGYGPPSDVEKFRTPYVGRPGMPLIIYNKSVVYDSSFAVGWTIPFNGGAVITNYTVWYREVTPERNASWNKRNVSETAYALYLERGREYEFAVTAWNIHGESIFDENGTRRFILRVTHPTTNQVKMLATSITLLLPMTETNTTNEVPGKKKEGFMTKALLINIVVMVALFFTAVLLLIIIIRAKACRSHDNKDNEVAVLAEGSLKEEVQRPSHRPPAPHAQKGSHLETEGVYSVPDLPDRWELPRSDLVIKSIFGQGAFGQVARGFAQGIQGAIGLTEVAVKMLRDDADEGDRFDLLSELQIMKKLRPHPNVIRLVGCVTKCPNGPMVIVEFASNGDLLGFLRKSRGMEDPYYNTQRRALSLTAKDLLRFSREIANGMSHLSASGIVHRDLAARNVLVSEHRVCKVTDFGMSRNVQGHGIYRMRAGGRLPVKWTSSEALLFQEYTTQSDVWSFGVVLYEIFTLGMYEVLPTEPLHDVKENISNIISEIGAHLTDDEKKLCEETLSLVSGTKDQLRGSDYREICIVLAKQLRGGTPYPGISTQDLVTMIKDGYRMSKPQHIDERLYSLMLECWQDEPKQRPTFPTLCSTLKLFAGHSQEYIEMKRYQSKEYLRVDSKT